MILRGIVLPSRSLRWPDSITCDDQSLDLDHFALFGLVGHFEPRLLSHMITDNLSDTFSLY